MGWGFGQNRKSPDLPARQASSFLLQKLGSAKRAHPAVVAAAAREAGPAHTGRLLGNHGCGVVRGLGSVMCGPGAGTLGRKGGDSLCQKEGRLGSGPLGVREGGWCLDPCV